MIITLAALATRSPEETLRALREGWVNSPVLSWLLPLGALLLAGLLTAAIILHRRQAGNADAGLTRNFTDLTDGLALSYFDRRLLARIARQQKLPTPLTLLLSPRTMRHHAAAYWRPLSGRTQLRVARRIARLRRHLLSDHAAAP